MTASERNETLRGLMRRCDHISDPGLRDSVGLALLDVAIGFGHREYIRGAGRTWWSVASSVALWTWLYVGATPHWGWGALFVLGVLTEAVAVHFGRGGDALLDELDRTVAEYTATAFAMRHEARVTSGPARVSL